ncbi:hypothetical protein A3Q56_01926, partial [Intoshia linei]
ALDTTNYLYDSLNDDVNKFYTYVSQAYIENEIKMGEYLLTYVDFGYIYALRKSVLNNIAINRMAALILTHIPGLMAFKLTHFEPRFLLCYPVSCDLYETNVKKKLMIMKIKSIDLNKNLIVKIHKTYSDFAMNRLGSYDGIFYTDSMKETLSNLYEMVDIFLNRNQNEMIRENSNVNSEYLENFSKNELDSINRRKSTAKSTVYNFSNTQRNQLSF